MYLKLKVLLPHLKSNSVWNMVHDPEKLAIISRIGLFYINGSQVSLFEDESGTLWMVAAFDDGDVPKHFRVTNEILRNCYIREYRYHTYIGDPLNIDFETYSANPKYERIDNTGRDYAEAALGGLMILTAASVLCHAVYKRFTK